MAFFQGNSRKIPAPAEWAMVTDKRVDPWDGGGGCPHSMAASRRWAGAVGRGAAEEPAAAARRGAELGAAGAGAGGPRRPPAGLRPSHGRRADPPLSPPLCAPARVSRQSRAVNYCCRTAGLMFPTEAG